VTVRRASRLSRRCWPLGCASSCSEQTHSERVDVRGFVLSPSRLFACARRLLLAVRSPSRDVLQRLCVPAVQPARVEVRRPQRQQTSETPGSERGTAGGQRHSAAGVQAARNRTHAELFSAPRYLALSLTGSSALLRLSGGLLLARTRFFLTRSTGRTSATSASTRSACTKGSRSATTSFTVDLIGLSASEGIWPVACMPLVVLGTQRVSRRHVHRLLVIFCVLCRSAMTATSTSTVFSPSRTRRSTRPPPAACPRRTQPPLPRRSATSRTPSPVVWSLRRVELARSTTGRVRVHRRVPPRSTRKERESRW
jgi:hypothetical protein